MSDTQSLAEFTEKAYLDYARYVILDRALPHLADGLKPVQRRIVYAMRELGLSEKAKHKKSARTVGDVIGKYHPHGDSACYEAMVLMAQDFSYRYPLIDGQGNWGSADDPKSFAAMRYTESRLTAYAKCLLTELEQGTVAFNPNFDGTLSEPALLPARLPNILLNGGSGIAVGMATHILPHNVREMGAALCALLANPHLSDDDLLRHLPAPDFPTGGVIVSAPAEIAALYQTGKGTIRLRARYHLEDHHIIIDELPFQVSGSKIQEQIAKQMQGKKLPWLEDLRDESDHQNPVRLVLIPRSPRVDNARLMEHLFATTDLEKRYNSQMNMIGLDGRPAVKNLRQILTEWLNFRQTVVRQRLQFQLAHVSQRLHILAGLTLAFRQLSAVIAIIRNEDDPLPALQKLHFSATQAEMLLNCKLRALARLEEEKIAHETQQLQQEERALQAILGDDARLQAHIAEELQRDVATYGDARRSEISPRPPAEALREEALIPVEPVTLVLSQMGWVRGAKGHQIDGAGLSYKGDDGFLLQLAGRSNDKACLLSSDGRAFTLPLHDLPSARGYGEPLSRQFSLAGGANILSAVIIDESAQYLAAASNGYGFVVRGGDLWSKTKTGKILLTLPDGATPLPLLPLPAESCLLFALSNEGRAVLFPCEELPQLAKGKGNQIIAISKKTFAAGGALRHVVLLPPAATLQLLKGAAVLTITPAQRENYFTPRGHRGQLLPKRFQQPDALRVL